MTNIIINIDIDFEMGKGLGGDGFQRREVR